MNTLGRLGNIMIEGKPGVGKTTLIEYYLKEIKNKNKIVCDSKGIDLYDCIDYPNTKYYGNNFDEFYDELINLINTNNKRVTYIIVDDFFEVECMLGKTKELFDYLFIHYKKHNVKLIVSSQVRCFYPNMKRYANTYIKLNSTY